MRKILFLLLAVLMVLTAIETAPAAKKIGDTAPPKTISGKWRIGYLEGGHFQNYPLVLAATFQGLAELGWIEHFSLPRDPETMSTQELWNWLAENVKSRYLEIVPDAFWTSNWDVKRRPGTKEIVHQRLKRKNIDLMIAMGTWAGQDLANENHSVPSIVMATTDPISAKIVKSATESTYDHIHARVDPTIHERQLRLFHEITGFRKLGIAFENSESGRSFSAVDKVESVTKKLGVELVKCYTKASIPDTAEAEASVVECCRKLAPQVDAMYVTIQKGVSANSIPRMIAVLNKHGIPTFSQFGSNDVKYGLLLSLAQSKYKYVGFFHAETIARTINGVKPGRQKLVFEDPSKIAINLQEAMLIGFDPPIELLGAADEIYFDFAQASRKH